jgi:c-di-GMP-related signal transduction protein
MATTIPADLKEQQADDPAKNSVEASQEAEVTAAPEGLLYVARQPILDGRGNVHGYELLFRSGPTATSFSGDGNSATRTVLDNTVIFGLERLSGGLAVFVNCTLEAIVNRLVLVLPPELTVLELLETLQPTRELLNACVELKAQGFRLALDDFTWTAEWEPFVAVADYIKVDLSTTTSGSRANLVRRVRKFPARLVAERVETQADMEAAKREGFTLFQGYYFCRPKILENRALPSNRRVHLEMLHALHEEPLNTQRISSLVKREPSLMYRLLRMVNSPILATRNEVTSIHGALVMIGDDVFRRVAMLAIASELRGNRPSELLRMAFLRGRFCELTATTMQQDPREQYLLGILSLLPAMLQVTMENIASGLPLRKEVQQALLGQENAERAILRWLESYELARWEQCDASLLSAKVGERRLSQMYGEALLWAEENIRLAG